MSGPSPGIRVGLVEDEPAMRRRLVDAIDAADGMHVVLQAARADEALAWLGCHAVDVMLVDLGLPDRPGLEVIAACRRSQPWW
ncbi:response regulator [Piscinibacter sakaiensis]|uniref:response regulator transcription factor n=1 Tax=Piscinibacter sakaiensis TaxID=1547922 RepID=UPI00372B46D0